jgi:hypothetical protein
MEEILTFAAVGSFSFLVFRKAGFKRGTSVWMAIGMFIPLVNGVIAIHFVSTTWPVERLLSAFRLQAGVRTEEDAVAALAVATRLESLGDAGAAITKYEEVIRWFGGSEAAKDAELSMRSLRAKIAEG